MSQTTEEVTPVKSFRIVLAEDEPLLAMLLEDVLKEMGHDVCAVESTEANTVAAGLRLRPDIMIVDAGLTRGSGVSAMTEILRTVFIAHVFISGDKLWDRPLHPRAVLLQKPFQESDLASAIEQAMSEQSSGGEGDQVGSF